MSVEKLFEPLILKNGVIIKNRLYKGAMSEGMADKTHRPTQELINVYKRWVDIWQKDVISILRNLNHRSR